MSSEPAGDVPCVEPSGSPQAAGGPLLGLVARALEMWLRQQCDSIGHLDIRMEGSAARLLRGRLEGVSLVARNVVYQELVFEAVELRSEAIRIRMAALLRRQTVELENPFRIHGTVTFTGEGLSRSLVSPAWRSFGDGLAAELLGPEPLASVRIEADHLIFQAAPEAAAGNREGAERVVRLARSDQGLELHPLDAGPAVPIPMDPGIRIEEAALAGDSLTLTGEAEVLA